MNTLKKTDPTQTYFSRAGKASLSKFKILLDKEKILKDERPTYRLPKVQTEPHLSDLPLDQLISEELESLKFVKSTQQKSASKSLQPSAVFLSPGRTEIFPKTDVPDPCRYAINYSLVQKNPVIYSMPKQKKEAEIQSWPDSFLSPSLHQFPDKHYKGIAFQNQTARKDLTLGFPSPHEERFKVQNLIPSSCSKYGKLNSPDMGKYAERKEFYRKKEYSPDYRPNKEFVLPKLAMDIKFDSMTERKVAVEEKDWPNIYDVNMARQEKKSFMKELAKKQEKKRKERMDKEPRMFSPSKLVSMSEEL